MAPHPVPASRWGQPGETCLAPELDDEPGLGDALGLGVGETGVDGAGGGVPAGCDDVGELAGLVGVGLPPGRGPC